VAAGGDEAALAVGADQGHRHGGGARPAGDPGVDAVQLLGEPAGEHVVAEVGDQAAVLAEMARRERRIARGEPGSHLTLVDDGLDAWAGPIGERPDHQVQAHVANDGQLSAPLPHSGSVRLVVR
jgi:hypothetical protein